MILYISSKEVRRVNKKWIIDLKHNRKYSDSAVFQIKRLSTENPIALGKIDDNSTDDTNRQQNKQVETKLDDNKQGKKEKTARDVSKLDVACKTKSTSHPPRRSTNVLESELLDYRISEHSEEVDLNQKSNLNDSIMSDVSSNANSYVQVEWKPSHGKPNNGLISSQVSWARVTKETEMSTRVSSSHKSSSSSAYTDIPRQSRVFGSMDMGTLKVNEHSSLSFMMDRNSQVDDIDDDTIIG